MLDIKVAESKAKINDVIEISLVPEVNGRTPAFIKNERGTIIFDGGSATLEKKGNGFIYKIRVDPVPLDAKASRLGQTPAKIGKLRYFIGKAKVKKVFIPRPSRFYHPPRGKLTLKNMQSYLFYFAPPPQIFCLEVGGVEVDPNGWIGFGLGGVYKIDGISANFSGGFCLEMRSNASDNFESPEIVIVSGEDEWSTLENYSRFLADAGKVQRKNSEAAEWWTNAGYCTWGDQMVEGSKAKKALTTIGFALMDSPPERVVKRFEPKRPNLQPFLLRMARAFYSRINEGFVRDSVEIIEKEGWKIKTVVLDDKWMKYHGEAQVNEEKFPKFREFISELHGRGYKVLVWYPIWWLNPESETAKKYMEYIVKDADGNPTYRFDITNPAAREHIEKMLYQWLSPDGYDLDGLKLDFTYDCPSIYDKLYDPSYGLGDELCLKLHELIYKSAKKAKNDALVISISPNPFVAQWCDMIRLNDNFSFGIKGQLMRARVSRVLCPDTPIDSDTYNHKLKYTKYFAYAAVYGTPMTYYVRGLGEKRYGKMKEILEIYDKTKNAGGKLEVDGNVWRRVVDGNVVIETDGKVLRGGGKEIHI
jgi:hypothetical protein